MLKKPSVNQKSKHAFILHRQDEKMKRRKYIERNERKNERKFTKRIRLPAVGDDVGTAVGDTVGPENSRKRISRNIPQYAN